MKSKFRKITSCRLCQSKDLNSFVDFGCVPLGNNLEPNLDSSSTADEFPLEVVRCKKCSHFQLSCAVNPKLLYARNYTYLSGIGKSFLKHMEKYVNWIEKKCNLIEGNFIIDIGSNDGSCLEVFKKKKYKVLGVDPAVLPAKIALKKDIPTINKFFDKSVAAEICEEYGFVDVITSQNVLAHVDNLKDTFINIFKILKEGGFLVFEIGYFKNVLETGCFDTIYHEHLDYHHANSIVSHLNEIGFSVIELETNDIQGGTLRILAKKSGETKQSSDVVKFLNNERKSVLYNDIFLKNWEKVIYRDAKEINKLLSLEHNNNRLCFAYGAPTKAVLLLKISKLNSDHLDFIADDNVLKTNKYIPRLNIPIVSTSNIDFNRPATILLLAWNFSEDIIANLKLEYKVPVKVIIPLPQLRIINI